MPTPIAVLLLAAGCATANAPAPAASAPAPPVAAQPASNSSEALVSSIERYYWERLDRDPPTGSRLGYHQYDGRLPDVSPAAIAQEEQRLHQVKAELDAIDTTGLSPRELLERDVVVYAIRGQLFDHERRQLFRQPRSYISPLGLSSYVSRAYASAADRARGVIGIARASTAFLAQADANLEQALPRPWLQTALSQLHGMIGFVEHDVAPALGPLEPSLQGELDAALAAMAEALRGFVAALEGRLPAATDDYALGGTMFLRMLEETQGVQTTVEELERIAARDVEQNLAALAAAAREIDPKHSTREVVARVLDDKPEPDRVLAEAEAQSQRARAFVVEHAIATVPSQDLARVRATPPYLRYNLAMLNTAGPFERLSLPSFYYISPPDPSWPAEKQHEYLPDVWSLRGITVHELWPGHFLHTLHIKHSGSRVLQTFRNYSTMEGWAHYTEDMMWQEGFEPDPRFRVGQLVAALLRDVRLMCSIGLHARGMSVSQAAGLFRDKAFQDQGNAEQQAARGTFDPMYGAYTLGKLMIRKLREDYAHARQADGETFSLKEFHDRLLSYGGAPIPLTRREMLGPDAGPAL